MCWPENWEELRVQCLVMDIYKLLFFKEVQYDKNLKVPCGILTTSSAIE